MVPCYCNAAFACVHTSLAVGEQGMGHGQSRPKARLCPLRRNNRAPAQLDGVRALDLL